MSTKAQKIFKEVCRFMQDEVYPNEKLYEKQMKEFRAQGNPWQIPEIVEQLKIKAKKQGLWNLFYTPWSGLTQAEYCQIAEITGRPEGTVKADISRGLSKLRTALEAEEAR